MDFFITKCRLIGNVCKSKKKNAVILYCYFSIMNYTNSSEAPKVQGVIPTLTVVPTIKSASWPYQH